MRDGPWNHNIHYQRIVLANVPVAARRALDVGCGDGLLVRDLAGIVPDVVGLDPDAAVLGRARANAPDATFVHGDLLAHSADDNAGAYDLVASISTLHHLDMADGLRAMARLLAPGGRVVVIGCARGRLPHDLPWELAGAVRTRVHKLRHGYWEHTAAVADPALTYPECRAIALAELAGARFRRLAMWRYALIWTKPLVR